MLVYKYMYICMYVYIYVYIYIFIYISIIGLSVLIDEFHGCVSTIDMDRLNTLQEITSSCEVALSILNDLLTYDKLESGALKIEKKLETILPFLKEQFKVFIYVYVYIFIYIHIYICM
jgi:signal transduction histidine kinase